VTGQIRVYVVDYGRKFLQMRYRDPVTGKHVVRSTGKTGRRDAERAAAVWEAELQRTALQPDGNTSFERAVDLYDEQHLRNLVPRARAHTVKALADFQDACNPVLLRDVTSATLGHFESTLQRQTTLRPSTITQKVRAVISLMHFCRRQGLVNDVPSRPRIATKSEGITSRGRPLTEDEFAKMLATVPQVIPPEFVADWQWSIECLWNSGLRLGEACELYWDRTDKLWIDFGGEYPTLRIPAALDKSRLNRVLPMAPEFAKQLEAVPKRDRVGPILRFTYRDRNGTIRNHVKNSPKIGKKISTIGRRANILVNPELGKYASAHDLRRSFGERWAKRVLPQVLMELMRHTNIETTMRYYVGQNAQRTNAIIWEAWHGSTFGSGNSETT
jgi:integrase